VLVRTHDLLFRAKLAGAVERAGWTAVTSDDAPVAIVELRQEADIQQVQTLVARGGRVLAFGSHVAPQLLRRAREAGAHAVPNSQIVATVERTLSEV
jgi:putative N-acetylmannosamine-6-phosphate epimerase